MFEFATGILNVQLWYPWHFNFVVAHYYGAWVFLTALVLHVAVKLPVIRRAYRERGDAARDAGLVGRPTGAPTVSRRGLLGLVGAASAGLLRGHRRAVDRRAAAPPRAAGAARRRGAPRFPVNKTAAVARDHARAGRAAGWRLTLAGTQRAARSAATSCWR